MILLYDESSLFDDCVFLIILCFNKQASAVCCQKKTVSTLRVLCSSEFKLVEESSQLSLSQASRLNKDAAIKRN